MSIDDARSDAGVHVHYVRRIEIRSSYGEFELLRITERTEKFDCLIHGGFEL